MALRDVTEADLPILFEHQREPEGNRVAAFAARDREDFMTHWGTNVLGQSRVKKKAIVEDDQVVGNIVSWDLEGNRFVGYWIGQAYWGRGIATAALAEFVRDHEVARPVFAYVAVGNVGSVRVLEKCGFRRSGEAVTGPDGVDELLMQLAE
jgi:RimJ/RimL family protein N-acetyltransferase